jgi:serine acetyltransferase
VIFPGADIAEGVSVGAMSLVLKPTEEWSIYVGVPAKKLRSRSTTLLNQEQQFLATQVGRE